LKLKKKKKKDGEGGEDDSGFVSLTPSFPGHILKIHLRAAGHTSPCLTAPPTQFIARKDAYLAHRGSSVKLHVPREHCCSSSGAGMLAQRIEGESGIVYLAAAGIIIEKVLGEGEELIVDTSSIVLFESSRARIGIYEGKKSGAWWRCCCCKEDSDELTYSQIMGPGRVYLQGLSLERFHTVV
jgi:uncharacterized protein (AIM24 family)